MMPESTTSLVVFLSQTVIISLSGVMAPGAITAATLTAGTRSQHAGALVAVGHGIVEFPLMFLIMVGMGAVFKYEAVQIAIGIAGGAILLLMAVQMFASLRNPEEATAGSMRRGPVLTGVLLSAGNPYFLVWWATVGLRISLEAMELGVLAFALFAVIHWLCDLAWLEALSMAAYRGSRLLGVRAQRIILAVSTVALAVIGVRFLVLAALAILY